MMLLRSASLAGFSCFALLLHTGFASAACVKGQPEQTAQVNKQMSPRTGHAANVAANFYPGMSYSEVVNQIGSPDQIMSRRILYRWERDENFFAIAYTEDGQFAGSASIHVSTDNAFSDTDHDTFQQLVNRQTSYAEFAQAFGDATRTLEEVEYGWLYENNVFLRIGVMEEKGTGIGYW